jgi:YVTN family beta-propeller protein
MAYQWGPSVTVGTTAYGITFGFGSLWVANGVSGTVSRVDPTALTVTATIATGTGGPFAITSAFGSVWVGHNTALGQVVSRIDPTTNTITASVATGFVYNLTFDANYIWATYYTSPSEVLRIDPSTNTVTGTFIKTTAAYGLAAGGGSVWVADGYAGTVIRVNPSTLATTATITTSIIPQFLVYAFGDVWAADSFSSCIVERISPATNTVTATISTPSLSLAFPFAITADSTAVWLASNSTSNNNNGVGRIDPATNTFSDVLYTLPNVFPTPNPQPRGLGVDGTDKLWVSYVNEINRVDPIIESVGWVRGHAWG